MAIVNIIVINFIILLSQPAQDLQAEDTEEK